MLKIDIAFKLVSNKHEDNNLEQKDAKVKNLSKMKDRVRKLLSDSKNE